MLGMQKVLVCFLLASVATSVPLGREPKIKLDVAEDETGYFIPRTIEDKIAPNAADWMKESAFLQHRTLPEITFPGTHDSGAYWLSKAVQPTAFPAFPTALIKLAETLHIPVEEIVANFALAQDRDFYEQAMGGIRYFDVRCAWNNTDWVTFHGLQGHPIQTLLSDIRRFLDEHTGEVVLVEISHFIGNNEKNHLAVLRDMVESTFGSLLAPYDINAKFGDMVKANHRAVVTMEQDAGGNLWSGTTIFNTYANSDILSKMELYDDEQIQVFRNKSWGIGPLFKISYTLTTQVATIEHILLPGHPRSLKALATEANNALAQWSSTLSQLSYPRFGNVFIMDFFAEVDIIAITQQQ